MAIFSQCGPYGYLAMAAGLVMLAVCLGAAVRGARRLTWVRLAIWCLLPVLIGYGGSLIQRRVAEYRLGNQPVVTNTDLDRAGRSAWDSLYVGLLSIGPGLTVIALRTLVFGRSRTKNAD